MENLEKYKSDLSKLIGTGDQLLNAIQYECHKAEFKKAAKRSMGHDVEDLIKTLPDFTSAYQNWYSESKTLIRQLLPDRLNDFVGYYEVPNNRKDVTYTNYRVSDYLLNLTISRPMGETVVSPAAAIPKFRQQLLILKSIMKRFKSSLFDIRQLVQADLIDSDLEAAKALIKSGFLRSAGAMAGVVME